MENIDRLQQEWAVVNASRELLALIKNNPGITYSQAVKFAKEIDEHLVDTEIGKKKRTRLEKLYDKYAQEALARSREVKKEISAEELIEDRLSQIDKLLNYYTNEDQDPDSLRKEGADLLLLLKTKKEGFLELQAVTESQAIMNDAFQRANKVLINSELGKFNTFLNKENGSVFRVAVLHPNPSEVIVGADLILEQYDETRKRVRIVAIQYKIWEKQTLYYSQAGNLDDQLKKMEQCFCDDQFCSGEDGQNASSDSYRLPYCMAFLRPTDKLQNPNALSTSSYHIPICKIDNVKELGYKDYKIRLQNIEDIALKNPAFEQLFSAGILGSRWLDIQELENLYRRTKVLEPSQRIVLYAQNYLVNGVRGSN